MKKTTTLIAAIAYMRFDEMALIVAADPEVIKQEAKLATVTEKVNSFLDFETSDNLECSINLSSAACMDAAYRVGLADGMRLAQELRDSEMRHKGLLESLGKGDLKND